MICEAKAVAGFLHLNSLYTTTIRAVIWDRKLHVLSAYHLSIVMAVLRFLFRFTRVASRSIGANVRHSWNFMHNRTGDMEEEAPAVHSVSLQLTKHGISFLAAGTCVVERTSFAILG